MVSPSPPPRGRDAHAESLLLTHLSPVLSCGLGWMGRDSPRRPRGTARDEKQGHAWCLEAGVLPAGDAARRAYGGALGSPGQAGGPEGAQGDGRATDSRGCSRCPLRTTQLSSVLRLRSFSTFGRRVWSERMECGRPSKWAALSASRMAGWWGPGIPLGALGALSASAAPRKRPETGRTPPRPSFGCQLTRSKPPEQRI